MTPPVERADIGLPAGHARVKPPMGRADDADGARADMNSRMDGAPA